MQGMMTPLGLAGHNRVPGRSRSLLMWFYKREWVKRRL